MIGNLLTKARCISFAPCSFLRAEINAMLSLCFFPFFRSCSLDPTEAILNRVKKLGETFKQAYTEQTDDLQGAHMG